MKTIRCKTNFFHFRLPKSFYFSKREVEKWMAFVLVIAVVNLSVGCHSYFKVNASFHPTSQKIDTLNAAGKTIIVHSADTKWLLNDIVVKNNIVYGSLHPYTKPPTLKPVASDKPNRYLVRKNENQRYLLNEVHLYLNKEEKLGDNLVSIPVTSINRIEIYDKDTDATITSWLNGAAIGLFSAAAIVGLVAILSYKPAKPAPVKPPVTTQPVQSCPFIYVLNGEAFHFIGEIYSGSIHKPLERNDYLTLPTYSNTGSYSLKITNEVQEIQHTNLMELMVIDHPEGLNVFVDKYGAISTFQHPLAPSLVTNAAGKNVTSLVLTKDRQYYQSNPDKNKKPLKDYLILEFPLKENASSAKLIIHARNSFLLDYTMGKLQDLYGTDYDHYLKKYGHASGARMRQWSLDQGIPLSVYVERNGTWKFVDYYNIVGPLSFKDDVLKVALKDKTSKALKLKLEFGTLLWEIDYVGLDYTADQEVTTRIIPVSHAVNEESKDVTELLSKDDGKYYQQPTITNQAFVTFDLPEQTGQSRTVILHTKGWYQIIQQPEGKPNAQTIKKFRKPGYFNQFLYENLEKTAPDATLQTK